MSAPARPALLALLAHTALRWTASLLAAALVALGLAALAPPAAPAHAAASLRHPVDRNHPLLLMQLVMGYNIGFSPDFRDDNNKHWDVAQAWANVPDDVKPYVAFVLHPGHNAFMTTANARKWVEGNLAEGADLGVPLLVLWGETPTKGADNLTWIEHLYQTYPNFIGTAVSELTSVTGDIPGLLKLANTYGGYHVQSSLEENNILGSKMDTAAYWNSVVPSAANFIYSPKDMHKNFDFANAQAQGYWLSGAVGNWGPYFDAYAYYGCGVQGISSNGGGDRCSRSYPETVIGETMLDQYMQGATVYHLENQIDTPAVGDIFTPTFWQSVLPAFRYVIAHPAPTKATVVASTPVAFSEASGTMLNLPDVDAGANPRSSFYDGLYDNPPDIANNQGLWYYPRSSGRYYAIPRIPKLAAASVVAQFPNVLTASNYPTGLTAKLSYFNGKYPSKYTGDAFVQNLGNQWLVYNSNYSSSTLQTAQIPLSGTPFSRLELPELNPDTFAMVDTSSTGLHMVLDDYLTDRSKDLFKYGGKRAMAYSEAFDDYAYAAHPSDTTLRTNTVTVRAAAEPALRIAGYDGHYSYTQSWNASTGVYTLAVAHNGAVDITLDRTPGDGSGWTRWDDAAGLIGYSGTWDAGAGTGSDYQGTAHATSAAGSSVSFGFSGTSVEWLGTAGPGGGTADVAVDGTTVATGINTAAATTAAGQVLFKATGLTNRTHTITVTARGGLIDVDRFAYVPSQVWMLNDTHLQTFSYGNQSTDQAVPGANGWTIRNGNLELLPYVKPWFSDLSVFNNHAGYGNLTYQASYRTTKGTPGGLLLRSDAAQKTGYYLMLDPDQTNPNGDSSTAEVKLYKNGTTLLAAAATSLNLADNTWYTVKVVASGSAVTASVNGSQVLSTTDSSASTGLTGVRVESNTGGTGDLVSVDNVSVVVGSSTAYSSDFSSWSTATDWITEGALNFSPLPARSSFDQPWQWVSTSGTWSVVNDDTKYTSGRNGVLRAVGVSSGEQYSTAGPPTWGNQLAHTLVKLTAGSQAGVLLRVQDSNNLYQVQMDSAAGQVLLRRRVAGTWTTLGSAPYAFAANKWYELGAQVVGDEFTANVNGVALISKRDSTFTAGAFGYSVGTGATAQFDDAWTALLPPATNSTLTTSSYPWPAAASGSHTITGFTPVCVKTAKDTRPSLPSTVTAYYADGTAGTVAVTWPAAGSTQLATATSPYAGGQNQGRFVLTGTVSGTSVQPTAHVTVMAKLSSALTTSVHTTVGASHVIPTSFASVSFTTGSTTFTRTVYVAWDTLPSTSSAHTETITGTILGYPFAKATAAVTVS